MSLKTCTRCYYFRIVVSGRRCAHPDRDHEIKNPLLLTCPEWIHLTDKGFKNRPIKIPYPNL